MRQIAAPLFSFARVKRSQRPSGDQGCVPSETTASDSGSRCGRSANFCADPPSGEMRKIPACPSLNEVNAIHLLSGDQRGAPSSYGDLNSEIGAPPAVGRTNRSLEPSAVWA